MPAASEGPTALTSNLFLLLAIARLNVEGNRIHRRASPSTVEKRINVLIYMAQNPPSLSIVGITIKFGDVFAVLFVIITAIFITFHLSDKGK